MGRQPKTPLRIHRARRLHADDRAERRFGHAAKQSPCPRFQGDEGPHYRQQKPNRPKRTATTVGANHTKHVRHRRNQSQYGDQSGPGQGGTRFHRPQHAPRIPDSKRRIG